MSAHPASKPTPAEQRNKLENAARNGANWFYWIAGLSLLNSFIMLFAGQWNFIFGLGITQVFDALGQALADEAGGGAFGIKALAFGLSLGALSFYVLFGWLARRGKKAGFIAGMACYFLDGGIFLLAGDLLGAGFHGFALVMMGMGMKALGELQKMPAPSTAAEIAVASEPAVAADRKNAGQPAEMPEYEEVT